MKLIKSSYVGNRNTLLEAFQGDDGVCMRMSGDFHTPVWLDTKCKGLIQTNGAARGWSAPWKTESEDKMTTSVGSLRIDVEEVRFILSYIKMDICVTDFRGGKPFTFAKEHLPASAEGIDSLFNFLTSLRGNLCHLWCG